MKEKAVAVVGAIFVANGDWKKTSVDGKKKYYWRLPPPPLPTAKSYEEEL